MGSIFRTCDAASARHVYLTGYTPTPTDRFGRAQKDIAKTALGAELSIPWKQYEDPTEIIAELQREGFTVVGIEQDARAIDYKTYAPPAKALVLVGSEVEGLASELCDLCDALVEIPMRGSKESLNVSVAFGVALFRMFDK